jgi:hypothetical protein
MIRECFKTNSGIIFNTEGMKEIGIDPATLYPVVLQRPPAIPIESSNPKLYIADIPKNPPTEDEIAKITLEQLTQTEEEIDLADALAPIYDVLAQWSYWPWWILEILPWKYKYQTSDNQWHTSFKWNLGWGRHVPEQSTKGVRVHRSVKTRLDAEYQDGRKYSPAASLDLKYVTWVD